MGSPLNSSGIDAQFDKIAGDDGVMTFWELALAVHRDDKLEKVVGNGDGWFSCWEAKRLYWDVMNGWNINEDRVREILAEAGYGDMEHVGEQCCPPSPCCTTGTDGEAGDATDMTLGGNPPATGTGGGCGTCGDTPAGVAPDRASVMDDVLDHLSDDDQVSFAEFQALYGKHGDGSMSAEDLRDAYNGLDSFDAESVTDGLMQACGADCAFMDDLLDLLADDGQVTFAEFKALIAKHGGSDMSDAELRNLYRNANSFDAQSMRTAVEQALG